MPIPHIFLAILVAAIWGFNFLFVKFSLQEISPLWLCAIRFFIASVPAIFFIKPPTAPFRIIVLYGLFMFALQFSLLFMGMSAGMPPGLASLLMQVQVFFSIFFAAIVLKEIPAPLQIIGALVSFSGIALVGLHFDKSATLLGFILMMAAAATWGLGNLITKKLSNINMIALVIWGSFAACPPMFAVALIFEGPKTLIYSAHHFTWLGVVSVLYIVYISTWAGYGIWNWLLSRYTVAAVVPFTLLVPIFGMFSAALITGEHLQSWKLIAGLLVLGGLSINIIAARLLTKKPKSF